MSILLYPLDKVVFDDISITFGTKRSDVEALLGKGNRSADRCFYFNNEMSVYYDSDGRVEFFEFLGGVDGEIKPMIYGVSAFDTPADELTELLKKHNGCKTDHDENGYSRLFFDISVGVYRESTPESVSEMINEAASFGNPMSEAEIKHEMKQADHWATIGIGTIGYYQR